MANDGIFPIVPVTQLSREQATDPSRALHSEGEATLSTESARILVARAGNSTACWHSLVFIGDGVPDLCERGAVERAAAGLKYAGVVEGNADMRKTSDNRSSWLYALYLFAISFAAFGIGWYFLKYKSVALFSGNTPTNGQRIFIVCVAFAASGASLWRTVAETKRRL